MQILFDFELRYDAVPPNAFTNAFEIYAKRLECVVRERGQKVPLFWTDEINFVLMLFRLLTTKIGTRNTQHYNKSINTFLIFKEVFFIQTYLNTKFVQIHFYLYR